jgi:hypothetical protein
MIFAEPLKSRIVHTYCNALTELSLIIAF